MHPQMRSDSETKKNRCREVLPCAHPFASINFVRPCLVRCLACKEKLPALKSLHFGGMPSKCKKPRPSLRARFENRCQTGPLRKNKQKERTRKNSVFLRVFCGALEGTRTPDLLVRSQSLYPAELQAHLFFNSLIIIGAFPANVKAFVKKNQKNFAACGNLFLDNEKDSLLYYAKMPSERSFHWRWKTAR